MTRSREANTVNGWVDYLQLDKLSESRVFEAQYGNEAYEVKVTKATAKGGLK